MDSSSLRISPTNFIVILCYLLLLVCACPASSSISPVSGVPLANQTFKASRELRKVRRIRAHLRRINKPAVKTIQSPDGDLVDCVLSHLQPAFDHPKLKGGRPLGPPERPKGYGSPNGTETEDFQSWNMNGESCPDGTVPIRRVTEADLLRASSISGFGRKLQASAIRVVRRDTSSSTHEVHYYSEI